MWIMKPCPHCGSTDHYLFEAGALCQQRAADRGRFMCKRESTMDGFPGQICFRRGKVYPARGRNIDMGFVVLDEQGEEHFIGWPGEAFFNAHFEVDQ